MEETLGTELLELSRALIMSSAEYDAYCLHDVLTKRHSTDDVMLASVLATRSHEQLMQIQKKYREGALFVTCRRCVVTVVCHLTIA